MSDIKQIFRHWNIGHEEVTQIYPSAWSVGQDYVLKLGTDLGHVKRNLTIIKSLHEMGIPVAAIVSTVHGEDYLLEEDHYFFLSKRIQGKHIESIYDEDFLRIAQKSGEVIAELHQAFLKLQDKIDCWDNDLLIEMNGWVREVFNETGYLYVGDADFIASVKKLQGIHSTLPKQLIHRDLHFGNLLFEDGEVSGYIDFDLSQINIRIFDLSYFALGLLMNCINDEEKTNKWFTILKGIIAGYESITPMTDDEKKAAPCVMECIELLFTAYFQKQKKYELAQNASDMFRWIRQSEKMILSVFFE